MVYSILLPPDYSEEAYAQLYNRLRPLLPEFRRVKADALLAAKARVSSALAYLLLHRGLRAKYGFPPAAEPEFVYGKGCGKKPFLAPPWDGIFFSLSHCKTGAACALSDAPVGVDIQDIRAVKESAVQKFFDGLDLAHTRHTQTLQEAFRSPSAFCALWSRYEAYVKLTGEGIARSFADCGGLSEEFLLQNNVSVTTIPLSLDDQGGSLRSLSGKKEAAAYLSAASYGCAALRSSSASSSKTADFRLECLDFSDFCRSLLSQHS